MALDYERYYTDPPQTVPDYLLNMCTNVLLYQSGTSLLQQMRGVRGGMDSSQQQQQQRTVSSSNPMIHQKVGGISPSSSLTSQYFVHPPTTNASFLRLLSPSMTKMNDHNNTSGTKDFVDGVEEACFEIADMPLQRFLFIFAFASTMALIGVLFNLCLFKFFAQSKNRSSPTLYLAVLAFLDTGICTIYILMMGVDALIQYQKIVWLHYIWIYYTIPVFTAYRIFQLSSSYIIMAATTERVIMSSDYWSSTIAGRLITSTSRTIILVLILIFATGLRLITVWELRCEYKPSCPDPLGRLEIGRNHMLTKTAEHVAFDFYALPIIQVFIPFIILIVLNLANIKYLHQHHQAQEQRRQTEKSTNYLSKLTRNMSDNKRRNSTKKRDKRKRSLLLAGEGHNSKQQLNDHQTTTTSITTSTSTAPRQACHQHQTTSSGGRLVILEEEEMINNSSISSPLTEMTNNPVTTNNTMTINDNDDEQRYNDTPQTPSSSFIVDYNPSSLMDDCSKRSAVDDGTKNDVDGVGKKIGTSALSEAAYSSQTDTSFNELSGFIHDGEEREAQGLADVSMEPLTTEDTSGCYRNKDIGSSTDSVTAAVANGHFDYQSNNNNNNNSDQQQQQQQKRRSSSIISQLRKTVVRRGGGGGSRHYSTAASSLSTSHQNQRIADDGSGSTNCSTEKENYNNGNIIITAAADSNDRILPESSSGLQQNHPVSTTTTTTTTGIRRTPTKRQASTTSTATNQSIPTNQAMPMTPMAFGAITANIFRERASDNRERETEQQRLRSAAYTLVAIVTCYLACNTLGFCINLFERLPGRPFILKADGRTATWFYSSSVDAINFLFMFNSFVRFIIYTVFNRDLRSDLRAYYCSKG